MNIPASLIVSALALIVSCIGILISLLSFRRSGRSPDQVYAAYLRDRTVESDLSIKFGGTYSQAGKVKEYFLILDNKGQELPFMVNLETWEPSKRWSIAFDRGADTERPLGCHQWSNPAKA